MLYHLHCDKDEVHDDQASTSGFRIDEGESFSYSKESTSL